MSFGKVFDMLSDPVRREILSMLRNGRMSAGEISSKFNLTNATVSYHLSKLKKADLVFEEREKNHIYYYLNASVFEETALWFSNFLNNKGDDSDEE